MAHFTDVEVTDTFNQWRIKTNALGLDVSNLVTSVDTDRQELSDSLDTTIQSLSNNYVTLATNQTISGNKTFSGLNTFNEPATWLKEYGADGEVTPLLELKVTNSTSPHGQNIGHKGSGPAIDFYNPDTTTGGNTWLTSRIASITESANDIEPDASLVFYTGANTEEIVEKMRITSAGNVGIGTDDPNNNAKFTVKDSTVNSNTLLKVSSYRPSIVFEDNSTNAKDYKLLADGGNFTITRGISNNNTFTNEIDVLNIEDNGLVRMNYGISTGTNTSITSTRGPAGAFGSIDTLTIMGEDISFKTGGIGLSERLKIDVAGQVIIGSTDTTPWDNSSGDGVGTVMRQDGVVGITRENDTPLYINRISGDHPSTIADFRINGDSKVLLGYWRGKRASNPNIPINDSDPSTYTLNGFDGPWLRLGNAPSTGYSLIDFGDVDSYYAGRIMYHHGENSMLFKVNGHDKLKIYSNGTAALFDATVAEINARGSQAIATKGYVDTKISEYVDDKISGRVHYYTVPDSYTSPGAAISSAGLQNAQAGLASVVINGDIVIVKSKVTLSDQYWSGNSTKTRNVTDYIIGFYYVNSSTSWSKIARGVGVVFNPGTADPRVYTQLRVTG